MRKIYQPVGLALFFSFIFSSWSQTIDSAYRNDPFYQKMMVVSTPVPVFYNEMVKLRIQEYLKNTANSTSVLLGKSKYFHQKLKAGFKLENVPDILILISAVNTGFNPQHVEAGGSTGMWPLPLVAARKYELVNNSYIDERRNVERSAEAAAKYLANLNHIYSDWLKTLAAFKTGPVDFNLALHHVGGDLNYRDVHTRISKDAQECVEKFMALWYVWNYSSEHNLRTIPFTSEGTDTIHVHEQISLRDLGTHLNCSEDFLKQLNPELKIGIVPTMYNNIGVRLPLSKKEIYREKIHIIFPQPFLYRDSFAIDSATGDTIFIDSIAYSNPAYKKNKVLYANPNSTGTADNQNATGTVKVSYTIKSGDAIGMLADVFNCSIGEIKKWNKLRGNTIFKGQKLVFYVPASKREYYKKVNSMSMSQKRILAGRN